MLDVLITGVGGQGSVLAAKILAQAAEAKGWQVRTAETIGMAQRGGFVTSHVRMGDSGEEVYSPLIMQRSADLVIALEPAEAARVVGYLKPGGLLVSATSAIQPVSATLSKDPYVPAEVLERLRDRVENFVQVDDVLICERIGSRKALNIVMLTVAIQASLEMSASASSGRVGLGDAVSIQELKNAIERCVKDRFVALNCSAVDQTVAWMGDRGQDGE